MKMRQLIFLRGSDKESKCVKTASLLKNIKKQRVDRMSLLIWIILMIKFIMIQKICSRRDQQVLIRYQGLLHMPRWAWDRIIQMRLTHSETKNQFCHRSWKSKPKSIEIRPWLQWEKKNPDSIHLSQRLQNLKIKQLKDRHIEH